MFGVFMQSSLMLDCVFMLPTLDIELDFKIADFSVDAVDETLWLSLFRFIASAWMCSWLEISMLGREIPTEVYALDSVCSVSLKWVPK